MEKNTNLYFDEDYDKKYLEFIESKNTLSSKHINIFYEFLLDILSDEGVNIKTWIEETNFRKYIFEVNSEKKVYSVKLDEYLKTNNISKEKAITLKILKTQVEEKIGELYRKYIDLIGKVEEQTSTSEIKGNSKQLERFHSDNNPNLFTDSGYELFKYIVENYCWKEKLTQAKFINMYFYFKERLTEGDYRLVGSKKEYIKFVKNHYFDKAFSNQDRPLNYQNNELGKLITHHSKYKTIKSNS